VRVTNKAQAFDRPTLITGGVLLVIALAAWALLFVQPAEAMPSSGLAGLLLFLVAWGVMMAAMMLPSATPMIAMYGVMRRSANHAQAGIPTVLFALIYFALWVTFGIPVYFAGLFAGSQSALADVLPYALAVVLIAAGAYQFTPLKRACLRVCRNPLSFLWARSRAGYRGTLSLAVEHAVYCIGCCWALMVVLVAAGAMALNWVLLIAVVVLLEKLVPRGEQVARVTGVALVVLGVAVALNPDLAMILRPSTMGM